MDFGRLHIVARSLLGLLRIGPGFRPGQIAGLLAGATFLVGSTLVETSLPTEQQRLLGLLLMAVIFWITRALPLAVTSILALALAVVLGIARASRVFGAFSSPTLFLLIGGSILTLSVMKYGLGRRIALWTLARPGLGNSTTRIVMVTGGLAALLAAVVDNGAVAAMLVPIAIGLMRELETEIRHQAHLPKDGPRLRFETALMLAIAYGATVGGLLTPFANGSNLVGWYYIRRHLGITIDALTWAALALPVVALLLAVLLATILLLNRPEAGRLTGAGRRIRLRYQQLGMLSPGETNTALAFGAAVAGWLAPPMVGLLAGYDSHAYREMVHRLNPAAVAVLAAASLFVLPVSREQGFTMRWKDVAQMDWSPILLMGSGLALASLMADTGLAQTMGHGLAREVAGWGAPSVYVLFAAVATLFSELSSNIVSVSILVPLIPSIAHAGGVDGLTATLLATFAGVYGFMLPISTSANAVVFGSGRVPFLRMVRTGFLVDVTGIAILAIALPPLVRLLVLP